MQCPKCGTANDDGMWMCARCEYVLDTSFLGGDILNESERAARRERASAFDPDLIRTTPLADLPPRLTGPEPAEVIGGDSVILGHISDEGGESLWSGHTGSFTPDDLKSASGVGPAASVFIGDDVARALRPDAIPRQSADAATRRAVLTPFEAALLDRVDGIATLAEIGAATDLAHNDVRVAMALLLDKAMIELPADTGPETRHEDRTQEISDLPALEPPTALERPQAAPAFAVPLDDEPLAGPASGARPAMRVNLPVAHPRARAPVVRPAARAAAPGAPSAVALLQEAAVPPVSDAARARAAELVALCMKDLETGHVGRAWGYARMAADADPNDETIRRLLRDWDKEASARIDGVRNPVTAQQLLAASQKAEQDGDIPAAVEHMRKLCALAPNSASAHNRYGVLLATRAHEYRAGYDAVLRAVALDPTNMTFQSNMMKILAKVEGRAPKDGKKPGLLGKLLR